MPPSSISRHDAATPERRALLVLLVYLACILVAMLATGAAARRPWLVAGHVLAIVYVAAIARRVDARSTSQGALWLPVVALPVLYAELGVLFEASQRLPLDPLVLVWEQRLFGDPARTLASRAPWSVVSELLHAGYLSYYPLIVLPPLALALRGREWRRAHGQTVLALTLAFTSCFLLFAVLPVEGPRYRFGAAPGAPPGVFRDLARALLQQGSSRGTAFPSSHVAVSVALTLAVLEHQRPVGLAAAFCTLLIAVGAVYGGFHYAVDVVAGLAVGVVVAVAARRLSRAPAPPDGGVQPREPDGGEFSLPPTPGARDTSRTPR